MSDTATPRLMQAGIDCLRLFGHGPDAYCEMMDHGWIALSGEPGIADLNMIAFTGGVSRDEFDRGVDAVSSRDLHALLLLGEDAEEAHGWAEGAGFSAVGQLPLMERTAGEIDLSQRRNARMVEADEVPAVMDLAGAAFSLDAAACRRAFPGSLVEDQGVDVWVVEDSGEMLGCGIFVRTGDHAGVYTMATPPAHQRKGVGRAVIERGMAHYQDQGVRRFTLEATEQGYPLYERVGFTTVERPHVYVLGVSTQVPGE